MAEKEGKPNLSENPAKKDSLEVQSHRSIARFV
jgi:hypothetical protein